MGTHASHPTNLDLSCQSLMLQRPLRRALIDPLLSVVL